MILRQKTDTFNVRLPTKTVWMEQQCKTVTSDKKQFLTITDTHSIRKQNLSTNFFQLRHPITAWMPIHWFSKVVVYSNLGEKGVLCDADRLLSPTFDIKVTSPSELSNPSLCTFPPCPTALSAVDLLREVLCKIFWNLDQLYFEQLYLLQTSISVSRVKILKHGQGWYWKFQVLRVPIHCQVLGQSEAAYPGCAWKGKELCLQ